MENEKSMRKFEKPEIIIIRLAENDIITASSDNDWDRGNDDEGELI